MRSWELSIPLESESSLPLFVQIARVMMADIRRGRLRPGDLMPGTRQLAATLGVHRNTVIAAYGELAAEGWITTMTGRGTFVSQSLPDPRPRRFATLVGPGSHETAAFDLRPGVSDSRCNACVSARFNLAGWPDLRLLPAKALGRAWRRALERRGAAALSYGQPEGHPRLRQALAAMLSATRGLIVDESCLMVTRGTQGALGVIAHGLLRSGDVVATEDPGYRRAMRVLSLTGARLIPIPVDAHGMLIEHLTTVAEAQRIRAVFVTPHHQFPTTVTLSTARRLRLLDLARQHGFAIIEDDYDHEFHYEGRPILPLASADAAASVIYVGSLSKTLAPGLRLGYIAAPRQVIAHLAAYRSLLDTQGDQVLELAVADLIEDGEVQRHVRRARRVYRTRRDAMASLLTSELGRVIHVTVPVGGTALWVRVSDDVNLERWSSLSAEQGVIFETGDRFSFDGAPSPYVRFGFAGYPEHELAEAVLVLSRTVTAARTRRARSAQRP